MLAHRTAPAGQNVLGGVRQKVSVVFSDIRSFTTISENMDAVDLVGMLNECVLVLCDDDIVRY